MTLLVAIPNELTLPGFAQLQLLLLTALLACAAVIDWRSYRIPNGLTLSGIVLGLASNAFVPGFAGSFLNALAGMAVGFAILLPFYLLRVMGAGDVKLMAMVGAFLGLPQILLAVLFSGIAGGVAALLFVIAHRQVARLGANLGSLVQGAALSAMAGLPLAGLPQGASVGNLPYGVSISAGTVLYLASVQLGYL